MVRYHQILCLMIVNNKICQIDNERLKLLRKISYICYTKIRYINSCNIHSLRKFNKHPQPLLNP